MCRIHGEGLYDLQVLVNGLAPRKIAQHPVVSQDLVLAREIRIEGVKNDTALMKDKISTVHNPLPISIAMGSNSK